MLINSFNSEQINKYIKYIQAIGSLSGLFSENKIPFLHYRVVENIFCKSFEAENLSRADIAYDAKLNSIGIGLKTFISQNISREKIAEFNAHSKELSILKGYELAKEIAVFRNERIKFASSAYGIQKGIYHCLTRKENEIRVFEIDYKPIDVSNIKNIKETKSSIFFEDNHSEYSYLFSKSTLFRKFITPTNALVIPIQVIAEPYNFILELFSQYKFEKEKESENVILPLYSTRNSKENKNVAVKSGLNQWNAGGRKRDIGEIYIPVPAKIHQRYPNFFPPRDETFKLILPNKKVLFSKICQEGGKALMTNPNKALSKWLLRDVLKLKEREVLTYEHLKKIGIDSIRITKIHRKTFKIDFVKLDSYEKFIY